MGGISISRRSEEWHREINEDGRIENHHGYETKECSVCKKDYITAKMVKDNSTCRRTACIKTLEAKNG